MEKSMDRRQRKSREAIFEAFISLLSQKNINKITVSDIIEKADVGRATFYAHFETKDYLTKELCDELFCHIFDSVDNENNHKHIFTCNANDSVFLHLLNHIQKNDNNLLLLLSCQNNDLFLGYFKKSLIHLIESQPQLYIYSKNSNLPKDYWTNHIASTFVETVKWWIDNNVKESPKTINNYFLKTIYAQELINE